MEILEPHFEDGQPLRTPVVELGRLAMTWLNTRIRTFEGNEQFNHVEVLDEDNTVIAFQDDEVMDTLFEHNFPTLDLPYVDHATHAWFVGKLTKNLDRELEEL